MTKNRDMVSFVTFTVKKYKELFYFFSKRVTEEVENISLISCKES